MMLTFIVFLLLVGSIAADCPANSAEWNSNCYLFNATETGFADAEFSCKHFGGHLASIHDGFTNAFLAQKAKKNFSESTETDFWIGATNLIKYPVWNWTDGSEFEFHDWKQGEPNNKSGANCAALSMTDGTWSAQDCFKPKPFVCTTTTTYPLTYNCSRGWSYFAPTHSCYGADYGGFNANWSIAENYCQNFSAHLPSIQSLAEIQYLMNIWIGVYSVDGARTWKNTDGTDADFLKYENWCPESPANISGKRCVGICSCGYCDWGCSDNFTTICKKTIY